MSDKYIAKKYVTESKLIGQWIKCPNCHQQMNIHWGVIQCKTPKCKLFDVGYREIKTLTTIERLDAKP